MNQKDLKMKIGDNILEIVVHCDPGHSWAAIPSNLIFENLDISECSYQDQNTVFLEEDRDLTLWLDELKKYEIKYCFKEIIYNSEAWIRNLGRYEKQ